MTNAIVVHATNCSSFRIVRSRHRSKQLSSLLCSALIVLLSGSTAVGEDRSDYVTRIKPILQEKCYSCHGAIRQEGGLRLETRDLMLKGGDSGAVFTIEMPADSLILERVTTDDSDLRMPPEGEGSPLTKSQVELLSRWISDGAVAPHEEIPASPNQHWAFQPVVRPALPTVAVAESPPAVDPPGLSSEANPIDAFIAAGYAKHGLRPVERADQSMLMRRVYLDLTGLPPTYEQQKDFVNDKSPGAYERLVDQLLASPQYGERWGRHWMDIWRYTDWYGLGAQLRNSQKHIWHWRDWIVESLNADKGYDQMVLEMLAADELYPTDADKLRGTGFLARHYYLFNRTTWLDDTIEHTSKAFLGLTMNCVKCHAHKYDPIAHEDYYALRAFFEPYQVRLDAVPGQTNLEADGLPRIFDAHPEAQTFLHLRGDEKNIDKSQVIQPGLPAILTSAPLHIEPVELPPVAVNPALQEFVLEDSLEDAQQAIAKAREAVVRAQKQLATLQQLKTTPANAGADEESDDFIVDDFDSIREDDWQLGAGSWSVAGGKLIQTQTGASRAFLRTRHHHPADFIASIRFTTTGGDKWKSVGLAFDVTGTTPGGTTENANEKMIYLSAVEGGSKLQVSYKKDGQQVYPPKAAKALPVSLNTPYEMTIAIRGGLVNVLLNGEHRIAYQLPVPREDGVMDLVAFDAAVAFDSISVRRLPMDYSLIPASNDAQPDLPLTIEAAEKSLQVARLSLAAAELRPDAVRTAFDADRAKSGLPPAASMDVEESKAAIARAAVAARRYELAQAELSMAQAEQKPDDSKAMTAARDHLARARKAVDEPGEDYTSLTASKKALEGPDEKEESRRQPYPSTSTGRRTALARWMIDRRNPLTARVAVNHIWLRHFGQPLVETETDFGLRARQPVQHELLDWLAAELMENHWSMKHIHRLIVTSRTWQLSTSTLGSDDATMSTDRENAYYWRRNPVRMESQVIRDSLLQLAGALDLTMGGPSLDANSKSNVYRRSLYFKHSRDDQNEFLAMFDDADILRCYRRSESVVPQQALALANSELSLRMARTIAANMARDGQIETDEEFVRAVFRRILCREPSEEEQAACIEAMSETRGILTGIAADQTTQRVRENLTHAMINHNDFITIR